jgi:hypothetical protein
MRYAYASLAFFVLATIVLGGQAQAQISYSGEGDCNKGMFWPFVRKPGDCLTDAERNSGMTGTWRESEIEESRPEAAEERSALPAPGASTAETQPAARQPASPSPTPAPSSAAPVAASEGAVNAAPQSNTVQPAAARAEEPADGQDSNSDGRATYTGAGGCTKGIFWPFSRRPGDCLTDAEIRSGRSGTYQ